MGRGDLGRIYHRDWSLTYFLYFLCRAIFTCKSSYFRAFLCWNIVKWGTTLQLHFPSDFNVKYIILKRKDCCVVLYNFWQIILFQIREILLWNLENFCFFRNIPPNFALHDAHGRPLSIFPWNISYFKIIGLKRGNFEAWSDIFFFKFSLIFSSKI